MKNSCIKNTFLTLFLLAFCTISATGQTVISGKVTDAENGQPMPGVSIIVKGTVIGTVTKFDGSFQLTTSAPIPIILRFSNVGYSSQELQVSGSQSDLAVVLREEAILGQEVVISASRVEQSILKSPVSIEKMGIRAIKATPSVNFYDGLANLKGVDMAASSITFKSVNARGFNSTANLRFIQMVDGMDNQAPGLNFSVGNIIGVPDLDLESVELIPGAASALYGPNAFNGIMLMTSKNPFDYQGFSASFKQGINHVDGKDTEIKPLYDFSLRYAKAFNDKFAFKVHFSYLNAEDWHGNDFRDVSNNNKSISFTNPGQDLLHVYGDEAATTFTANVPPELIGTTVSRTGYFERDLVNYDAQNLKVGGALHYRIGEKLEAIASANWGLGTSVYTGANRYSLNNFNVAQYKLELKGDNFFVRGYTTQERSGDSYDSRFLALNLNRAWKSDQQWFGEYAFAFDDALNNNGLSIADSHEAARAFANIGRFEPGSAEFEAAKEKITNNTDLKTGAKFDDKTNLYHAEAQYDFSKMTGKVVDILVGANYRLYDLNSNGTIFPDTAGNPISIGEFGGFAQFSRGFFDEDRLRLSASIRADKSKNFDTQFSPRFSAVVTAARTHNFRASYQTGFRIPSTQEQYIDLDIGVIRLIGGLPEFLDTYNISNSWLLGSFQEFGAALLQGEPFQDAVLRLERTNVAPVKPEQVQSFELGYKSTVANKLFIDLSWYYSIYKDFLGTVRVVQPGTLEIDNGVIPAAQEALSNRRVFQVYTNSKETVTSQGVGLGLTYNLPRGFTIGGNATWTRLNKAADDPIIPAFNTPEWKTNVSFGNRELFKNFGFNAVWRWQDLFFWEASFGDGTVPSYHTFDLQFSYDVPSIKTVIKLGGANVFNNRYRQSHGGPEIGAIYYVSFTFDQLFN